MKTKIMIKMKKWKLKKIPMIRINLIFSKILTLYFIIKKMFRIHVRFNYSH